MNFVESLNLLHVSAKEIPCLTGKGAPTGQTEGAPGVLYMDTDTGDLYKCRGGEKDLYRWEMQGGGTAPVKGVDYYTESDKAEMVAMVLEALGGNVISGYVDGENNILITGLGMGSYAVKYEMEDGSTIDIGNLVLTETEGDEPTAPYTNLADPTSDEWLDGYRITSSGSVEPSAGVTLMNTIPCVKGDVIRVKGATTVVVAQYTDDGYLNISTIKSSNNQFGSIVVDGDYNQFTIAYAAVTSIRFYGTLSGGAEDVIITVNQEIV